MVSVPVVNERLGSTVVVQWLAYLSLMKDRVNCCSTVVSVPVVDERLGPTVVVQWLAYLSLMKDWGRLL